MLSPKGASKKKNFWKQFLYVWTNFIEQGNPPKYFPAEIKGSSIAMWNLPYEQKPNFHILCSPWKFFSYCVNKKRFRKKYPTFCVKNGFYKRFCRKKNSSTENKTNLVYKTWQTYPHNYGKELFLPIFLSRNNFLQFFFGLAKLTKYILQPQAKNLPQFAA